MQKGTEVVLFMHHKECGMRLKGSRKRGKWEERGWVVFLLKIISDLISSAWLNERRRGGL